MGRCTTRDNPDERPLMVGVTTRRAEPRGQRFEPLTIFLDVLNSALRTCFSTVCRPDHRSPHRTRSHAHRGIERMFVEADPRAESSRHTRKDASTDRRASVSSRSLGIRASPLGCGQPKQRVGFQAQQGSANGHQFLAATASLAMPVRATFSSSAPGMGSNPAAMKLTVL
jgi:hypothetical protein